MPNYNFSGLTPVSQTPEQGSPKYNFAGLTPVNPQDTGAPGEDQVSGLEAAVRGPIQYITAGLGDEAAGAIGAAKDKAADLLTGKKSDKSFMDDYREIRDAERKRNEEASSQHPYLYHGLGLGAGLVVNPLGDLLAPAEGASTISALARGAAMGGIAGVGSANTDLTKGDPNQIKQTALDTAAGMGVGTALGGVGKALEGLGNLAPTQKELFKAGQEGKQLLGKTGAENVQGQIEGLRKSTFKALKTLNDYSSGKLKAAKSSPDIIDAQETLQSSLDYLKGLTPKSQAEENEINKLIEPIERQLRGNPVTTEVPYTEQEVIPGKIIPYKPSTSEKLQAEAAKLTEQGKLSGDNAQYHVVETVGDDGKKYASLVKRTPSEIAEGGVKVQSIPYGFDQDAGISTTDELQQEANRLTEQSRLAGEDALFHVVETTGADGVKYSNLIKTSPGSWSAEGLKVKTLPFEEGTPEQTIEPQVQLTPKIKKVTNYEGAAPQTTTGDLDKLLQQYRDLSVAKNDSLNSATARSANQSIIDRLSDLIKSKNPDIESGNELFHNQRQVSNLLSKASGDNTPFTDSTDLGEIEKATKFDKFIENLARDSSTGRAKAKFLETTTPEGETVGIGPQIDQTLESYQPEIDKLRASGNPEDAEKADQLEEALKQLGSFQEQAPEVANDLKLQQELRRGNILHRSGIYHQIMNTGAYLAGKAPVLNKILGGTENIPGAMSPELYQKLSGVIPTQTSNMIGDTMGRQSSDAQRNPTATFSQNISKLPQEDLRSVANQLRVSGQRDLASSLEKALDTNNQYLKSAVLFSISSNPQARAALLKSEK